MSKYQAYSEYKSSSFEWIGSFPVEWDMTRVKFESYVKARVGWHGLKSDDFTDEGPYLVTGSDFRGPEIDWKECYHCDLIRYDQDPYIQLQEGDLLITKDGTIGKIALVRNLDSKATLNSGVFVVRALADNYTSRFYFWLLQSSVFTGFVDFNKIGSTIVHLYQDTFVNFRYAMPSILEQQKITSFLDHETTKIDSLIEKQQQLIKLLKEKRQAVISHAVTKGLNPNAPMKDSGVEWLGEVPKHWGVSKLKHLTTQIVDGAHFTPTYVDEGVPFLRVTDVHAKVIDKNNIKYIPEVEHQELIKRCRPKRGDLLLSKNGTIGVPKIIDWDWEFSIFVSLCLIKLSEKLDVNYAFYFFKTHEIKEQIYGQIKQSTVINLHLDKIEKFDFSVPPLTEQREIVLHLNKISRKYDLQVTLAEQMNALLRERRTALISAAVTGKIDVRTWKAPAQSNNKEVAA